jgi:cytidine kinase
MSLLAVGTVAFDTIETLSERRDRVLGGSATHFSFAASLFVPVRLVGMVGKDWPARYSELLASRNIDLSGLVRNTNENTYFWHGRYGQDFQKRDTLAWEVNGFDKFSPILPPHFRDSRFVFLAASAPNVQIKTLEQCTSNPFVVADTVDAWIETARDDLLRLLSKVDCLLINDLEAVQLSGTHNLIKAGKAIRDLGPKWVIIKKGEHGCLFFGSNSVVACPAYPVEHVIDPTGAGDSFAGGIVGWLALNRNNSNHAHVRQEITSREIFQAIQIGTVTASYAVNGFSVEGLAEVTYQDIDSRVQEFRSMLDGR